MYYFQHRLSFNIDLFLSEQQYLSFFSPKLWIDDFDSFNDSEYIDKYNHIGVVTTTEIKLDILFTNKLYLYTIGYIHINVQNAARFLNI